MSAKHARDQVLGHADEADGIEEYDNPLPNWWLGLFYLTIIWAVGYGAHYHFFGKRSQEQALAAEMADAERRWPREARAAATVVMSEEAIEAGEAVYKANCTGCHGEEMTGGIGPSLVDTVWIHGGTPEAILATITNGVPEKGMLTWGPILGPEKVAQVAAYVVDQNREANDPEHQAGHEED